jgi:integrase
MASKRVAVNPADRLGRFTRTARSTDKGGTALTPEEVQSFLEAAKQICPEYHPLFLVALRAGLRRGELVSLRWGDLQIGRARQEPVFHDQPQLRAARAHDDQK